MRNIGTLGKKVMNKSSLCLSLCYSGERVYLIINDKIYLI